MTTNSFLHEATARGFVFQCTDTEALRATMQAHCGVFRTSTLLAAWNAAIYVAQIEDDRLADVNSDRRYIEATRDVLQQHGGLWFYDESFVISRRRD